ncbi:hypothetical protein [Teredinibacter turnerae]|uniref:Lipoprotein n=1 Tax=Teredinibacter turnerae (strain ATCC 39867 / T7901) TaxID=377629 RepID=C5BKS1_TERTT|nr:hypothetical protein [Teredinibacter turnerae]ACR11338.1 hypothetical protein TERTU_0061 [Teredinibacter turnerae T7901]
MKFNTTPIFLASLLLTSGALAPSVNSKPLPKDNAHNVVTLVDLKDFPSWFHEAINREKSVKKKSSLKIKKFNINEKVLGKLKLQESSDTTWYYTIDIGTDSPVECYVFTEFDGPANSLHSMIENSLSAIAELNKKPLSSRYTSALGVGLVGDTPYLALDTLYSVGEGKNKASGILKGLSAATNNSLQICTHNELGYKKAFLNVFTSFINAFIASEENQEFFESVFVMSINDLPLGYAREKYALDEDGDIVLHTDSAMLAPVDASSVARSDSGAREWSMKDGSMINKVSYSIENNVLASSFSLEMRDSKWHVSGELQGKPVNAVLEHNNWLLSGYGSYLAAIELQKSDKISESYPMWVPEADPTSALKVVLSKTPKDPTANLKIDMGPMVMKFLAEKSGIFKHGTIAQGPITIGLQQLYVKGEPQLP